MCGERVSAWALHGDAIRQCGLAVNNTQATRLAIPPRTAFCAAALLFTASIALSVFRYPFCTGSGANDPEERRAMSDEMPRAEHAWRMDI